MPYEASLPIALRGFTPGWAAFDQGICASATLPTYEELCNIFGQEETKRESVSARRTKRSHLLLTPLLRTGAMLLASNVNRSSTIQINVYSGKNWEREISNSKSNLQGVQIYPLE